MPIQTPITGPVVFEGGHADFLAKQDMLRRNLPAYDKLVKDYGMENLFVDVVDSLGLSSVSKPTESPFADFYFEDKKQNHFVIGSVVTAQSGAGGTIVVALAAGEMKTINGRRTSRPRKNEIIIDKTGKNWKIITKNTTTNPHQLTIKPALATQTGTFVANDRFSIITPRFGEATGQPTGLDTDFGMYTNRFAIYKETQITSGTNMTTKENWMTVPELEGFAFNRGFADAEQRHHIGVSKGLVHDSIADNLTDFSQDFDTDVPDNGTEGLLAGINAQGKIMTYDSASAYDEADFERVVSYYQQKNLPGCDIAVLQGGQIATQVQKVLRDLLGKDNANEYLAKKYLGQRYSANERFNEEQLFIQLGFKGIQYGNFKFIFREISELNNMFGDNYVDSVNYSGYQIFIPLRLHKGMGKSKDTTLPSIHLLHRGQVVGNYERRIEIWETGGAGPVGKIKTDQFDVRRKYLRSEVCNMLVGGRWTVLQKSGASDS